jgi:hypothetical protein
MINEIFDYRANLYFNNNNLPAGYDENGNRETWGLSSRYNSKIAAWEKANEAEITELENAVIKAMKFPEHVYDSEFCKRFEELKSKFPKQYIYFGKKHWK